MYRCCTLKNFLFDRAQSVVLDASKGPVFDGNKRPISTTQKTSKQETNRLLAHCLTLLAIISSLWIGNAWAVLGQPPSGTTTSGNTASSNTAANSAGSSASSIQMRAAVPASTRALYSTYNNVDETGTQITEYATTAGIVFAVAWQGPVLPDMQNLLGSYFPAFTQSVQSSRADRSLGTPLAIQSTTLVVRSSGRMRNFSGYAYDPTLLPTGLRITDVFP